MKYLFTIILSGIIFNSYSQIKNIDVLLGKTDKEIINYFDSLQRLTTKDTLIILKDFSENGSQIFWIPLYEKYYTISTVKLLFERKNGVEICVMELLYGQMKYVNCNLDFIKNNFDKTSYNHWERKYNNNLIITASYVNYLPDMEAYTIRYEFKKGAYQNVTKND